MALRRSSRALLRRRADHVKTEPDDNERSGRRRKRLAKRLADRAAVGQIKQTRPVASTEATAMRRSPQRSSTRPSHGNVSPLATVPRQ